MAALGERIRQAIEAPIEIAGRPCHVTSSIGIAVAGQTGGLDLVRAADIAMYAAKQAGGNRALLFEPSLYDRASLRFELEEDMRTALSARRRIRAAVPTDIQGYLANPAAGRFRGVGAVEASAARLDVARAVHPAGREVGADPAAGRLGAGDGAAQGRLLRQAHPDANLR